jgi:hypothetical protein
MISTVLYKGVEPFFYTAKRDFEFFPPNKNSLADLFHLYPCYWPCINIYRSSIWEKQEL